MSNTRKRIMHIVGAILGAVGLVYAGMCLMLFLFQDSQVYFPEHNIMYTPAAMNMEYEDVRLKVENNETIAGWFVPASKKADGAVTVLFCHGNGGNIGDRVGSVSTFYNMGFNTFVFDYQGYGESTGEPSEKNTYMDARAAWKYLVEEKKCDPKNIILFGRSLGGAVTAELAMNVKPRMVVLESTFTSATDMADKMFPILPNKILCKFKYDSLAKISSIKCPVLIAHSKGDRTIPYENGQQIYQAANEPKQFVEMIGDHNYGGLDRDKEYQKTLKEMSDNEH